MAQTPPPASVKPTATKVRRRPFQVLLLVLLAIPVVVVWQVLNYSFNNTDPTVAGQPLSNPKTHLHLVALGGQPGVVYLGTHYGLFTSTDGGQTWPQSQGVLNTLMILNLAISPSNPRVLAVIGRPSSGIGESRWHLFQCGWRKFLAEKQRSFRAICVCLPFQNPGRFRECGPFLCLL